MIPKSDRLSGKVIGHNRKITTIQQPDGSIVHLKGMTPKGKHINNFKVENIKKILDHPRIYEATLSKELI